MSRQLPKKTAETFHQKLSNLTFKDERLASEVLENEIAYYLLTNAEGYEQIFSYMLSSLKAEYFQFKSPRTIFNWVKSRWMDDAMADKPSSKFMLEAFVDVREKLGISHEDISKILNSGNEKFVLNARPFCDDLVELWKERNMRNICLSAAEEIEKRIEPVEYYAAILYEEVTNTMQGVTEKEALGGFVPIGSMNAERIEHYKVLRERGSDVSGLPSGYNDLDVLTAGMHPAELIILGGRPGMGKTALALNIAANVCVKGDVPCAFFSLEMSKTEVYDRILALMTRIFHFKYRTGKFSNEDMAKIEEIMETRIKSAPLYINDNGDMNVSDIYMKMKLLKQTLALQGKNIGLVIVDHLHRIAIPKYTSDDNRSAIIGDMARMLKSAAKDMNAPLLLLSQLARKTESSKRQDKRPVLSDLRESGSIEQEADVVMMMYRDSYYKVQKKDDNDDKYGQKVASRIDDEEDVVEINVVKQRNGPQGTVKVLFEPKYMQFSNLEPNRREEIK